MKPRDPEFAARVARSFARQEIMTTLGAELTRVVPGEVEITLPYRKNLTQQHGYLHAGVVSTVLDSACGYAALTLMEKEAAVLAVEFKVNFLAPARGRRVKATGCVIRAGRTLTVCSGRAVSDDEGGETVVASMQSTVIAVRDRGISD